jgi:hypothetical protein
MAGFKTPPDPRNLGGRHIRGMIAVWQREQLAPATIQTYLSFLRGVASWLGKPGFIRDPAHYGLSPAQYQRHEHTRRDKSWTAAGIDIEAVLGRIVAYDRHVGASLRLIQAFGLRRKESVMFRLHRCVVPFEATGLPAEEREADHYVRIEEGAKGDGCASCRWTRRSVWPHWNGTWPGRRGTRPAPRGPHRPLHRQVRRDPAGAGGQPGVPRTGRRCETRSSAARRP